VLAARIAVLVTIAIAAFYIAAAVLPWLSTVNAAVLAPPAPNALLGLLLSGLSILLAVPTERSRRRTIASRTLAALVLALGVVAAFERATATELLLDRAIAHAHAHFPAEPPRVPAPLGAASLVLLGASLLSFDVEVRGRRPAQLFAAAAGAIAYVTAIARLYRAEVAQLAPSAHEPWLPLIGAIAFAALSLAILLARADRGTMARLVRDGPSGAVVRWIVVPLFAVPTALGAIAVVLLDARMLGVPAALAAVALLTIVLSGVALFATARAIDRARMAQLETEARFTEIFESASDAIVVFDGRGAITFANSAAGRLFGRPQSELLASRIQELLHIEIGDGPARAETTALRRDGAEVPVEVALTPQKVGDDVRITAIVRDASERVRTEAELRRWKELVECAAWGVVVGSSSGRFELVNPAFAAMHGYSIDELLGRPAEVVFAEEERRHLAQHLREVHELGHHTFESMHVRKDGSKFPVIIDANAVRDAEGKVLYRVVYVQDISERKAFEAARARDGEERERLVQSLAEERAWLRTVIEQSPVGILFIEGVDAPRAYVNARAEALRGGPIGPGPNWMPAGTIFTRDGRALARSELPSVRALRGEEVSNGEYVDRLPDGREVPILVNATPLRDARGTVRGAVVTLSDITVIRELERLRDEWTSLVAHDLRQPVQVIALASAMLDRVLGDDGSGARANERIRSAAKRLQRMVDDLLDLSRLDARKLELSRRRLGLGELVREIAERPSEATDGHAIEVVIRGEDTSVSCDADRIDQIVGNLLSNAAKYGAKAAPIRVEVVARSDEVEVAVTNDGPGIPPGELEHLFSRFFRSAGARASGVRGVGLGLHICRGLVEAHGGRIWAESTLGASTTFRFTLPRNGARDSAISLA
jgi:PAS domain S-box-containing protein